MDWDWTDTVFWVLVTLGVIYASLLFVADVIESTPREQIGECIEDGGIPRFTFDRNGEIVHYFGCER